MVARKEMKSFVLLSLAALGQGQQTPCDEAGWGLSSQGECALCGEGMFRDESMDSCERCPGGQVPSATSACFLGDTANESVFSFFGKLLFCGFRGHVLDVGGARVQDAV